MTKKKGEFAVGELITVLLSIATLVLGFFFIKMIHEKQTEVVSAGISSSLLQSYELSVAGELKEGRKLALHPSIIMANEGENSFFVLGVRNADNLKSNFSIFVDNEKFIYNNIPFQLQGNEIRLFTVGINTNGMKGSKPHTISILNSESIYATAEILVNVE